jgi:hypothetical protein
MKLIRHGDIIVALVIRAWEKAYLVSQRGKQEWVPLFLVGSAQPVAEVHSATRQVRLCADQQIADQRSVVFRTW